MIVAINSCPRFDEYGKSFSYLPETLAHNIKVARAAHYPIVALDDLHLTGSTPPMVELLRQCAKEYPGEKVLLLEDDVQGCVNAVEAVDHLPFPRDVHMLSLYNNRYRFIAGMRAVDPDAVDTITCRWHKHTPIMKGVYMQPATSAFCYAQAVLLSAKLVEHIAKQPPCYTPEFLANLDNIYGRNEYLPYAHRDRMLGLWASEISSYIGIVAPNWFQHIGHTSAVLTPEFEKQLSRAANVFSGNFPGYTHDALTDDVSCLYPFVPQV